MLNKLFGRGQNTANTQEAAARTAPQPADRVARSLPSAPAPSGERPQPKPQRPRAADGEAVGGQPASRPALRPVRAEPPAVSARPAVRREEADESKVAELLKWEGEVPTAVGGGLDSNDQQRLVCAYLGNGTLLVTKLDPLHPQVMQVRYALKRAGKPISAEYLVELDVLRKIHEAAEKRSGGSKGRNSGTEMQTEFLKLVGEAAAMRCSDIHMKVERYEARIRVRSDGVVQDLRQLRSSMAADLAATAFNMADASDASYRPYEYQGARISDVNTPLPEGVQSLRLQFNPLPNGGRHMVIRLLYAASNADVGKDIDTLGYNRVHIDTIKRMRKKPFGINVIAGPTGSGKSTTLTRALNALMREKRNQISVITIEDPPEYVIEGAAQLPVTNASTDAERNEKFRQAISASLRSDPDVIMIGEIRDKASSALAFAAAMTGHQVWASLHANDAISILDRFRDQQVEEYKISDHTLVTGLVGQRLMRRLCDHCKLPLKRALADGFVDRDLEAEIRRCGGDLVDQVYFANENGCEHCRSGYSGRMVIAECILPDIEFMRFIRKQDKEGAIAYWLGEMDGLSMMEHAIQKMVKGLADPRDVEDKAGELRDWDHGRAGAVFGKLFN